MRLDLKAPRGPTVGYGPHRTIYLAGQTGIDANGKVARASARRQFRRGHTGRLTSGEGWPWIPTLRLTLERKGCGYALANAGHDTRALQAWLGHKNIQHTVRYTELAPDRFKTFWR